MDVTPDKNILKDKTIMITGATSGIGQDIALALLDYDVKLVLTGRNTDSLKILIKEKKDNADAVLFDADFSKGEDIFSLTKKIREQNLDPDILIHAAGTYHLASVERTTEFMLDECYNVNFKAPFLITRELLDIIIRKKGHVIFFNSTASMFPKIHLTAYASIKSALKTFAEVLHQEVYPFGVRVTSIYPGRVATPMQKMVAEREGKEYKPYRYIQTSVISQTVVNLLQLPENIEINEFTIRPTMHKS